MATEPHIRLELSKRLEAFQQFKDQGESYSAVARLAEIFHCLQSLDVEEVSRWTHTLNEALASVGPVDRVFLRLQGNAERMRRILSVGSSFVAEELILLLTLRIEGDLIERFLSQVHGMDSRLTWEDIDQGLVSLANSAQHRRVFRTSQEQVEQNWGLPLQSKWLEPM